jgi:hypothetical protein
VHVLSEAVCTIHSQFLFPKREVSNAQHSQCLIHLVLCPLYVRHVPSFVRLFSLYSVACVICPKNLSRSEVLFTFRKNLLFTVRVVSSTPNPQAGGPPLVVCPRRLIRYTARALGRFCLSIFISVFLKDVITQRQYGH